MQAFICSDTWSGLLQTDPDSIPVPVECDLQGFDAKSPEAGAHTEAYRQALEGIRATQRGQQPKPPDAFLLRDVAMVLMDCGLRPEECFRLKWMENIRDGAIEIHTGKGRGSRRRIPISQRVRSILEMRRGGGMSEWAFPAPTKSGHIESSSLKKRHAGAVKASGVVAFVLCTFRHTCITRWRSTWTRSRFTFCRAKPT